MPSPQLADKYKGKTFGEISKDIESKYKDRFDPISKRGMMAEMETLREQQEYVKEKQAIREQIQQQIAQAKMMQENPEMAQQMAMEQEMQQQQMQQQQMQQMQQPEMGMTSNEGVGINPMEQPDLGHSASQSYNQQFGYGGQMNYSGGGPFKSITTAPDSGNISLARQSPLNTVPSFNRNINDVPNMGFQNFLNTTAKNQVEGSMKNYNQGQEQGQNFQGINPMRFAPLAGNIASLAMARKPSSIKSDMEKMGYKTSIDENIGNVAPRQTQFSNIDYSGLERGIQNQARGFSATNANMSGGNAGMFMANELGNQGNVMNAITQARMQQQTGNRQTQQMNAQEQARVDSMRQQQAGMRAGIQGQNMQMGMNLANIDAQNTGAFNNFRIANIMGLADNIGNIGRESDMMKSIASGAGYDMFGQFFQNGETKGNTPWITPIAKTRKNKKK